MKTVIAAVSGGVDSVVMLDMLAKRQAPHKIIIAHVDHGMRPESGADAEFVQDLAEHYGLPYESVQLSLGHAASEAQAREKRWKFLHHVRQKYQADTIATGHHADDVVETMIINITRGTGWRGIASLIKTNVIERPLLRMRKREIVQYAQEHGLEWREDATNQNTNFLRNRIRAAVIPRLDDRNFSRFVRLYDAQVILRAQIDDELRVAPELKRYDLAMWPDQVAREVLRCHLGALPRVELERALLFARTALANKKMPLSNGLVLESDVKQLIVVRGED